MRPRRAAGFTLIELVVSMSVLSLVLGGLSGVLILVSRAVESAEDTTVAIDRGIAMDMLAEDLALALAEPSLDAQTLTITVPDRNEDDVPETIVYAISAGELERSIGGSDPHTVAAGVSSITLRNESTSTNLTSDPTVSTQRLLSLWSDDRNAAVVHRGNWLCQPFMPNTGGADSLRITNIRLHVKHGGFIVQGEPNKDEIVCVQVYELDVFRQPIGPVLAEVELHPSRLAAGAQWLDLPVPVSTEIETGTLLGIVLKTELDISYGPSFTTQRGSSGGGIAEPMMFSWGSGWPFATTVVWYLACEVDAELTTLGSTSSVATVWRSSADVAFDDGTTRTADARVLSNGEGR